MGTSTPNLQLFKPDPDDDNVNVETDLNANYDKIDTAVKAVEDSIDDSEIRFFAKNGTASPGSGNWTSVGFSTEDKDTADGHDTGTNNSRYTSQVAGSYEFYGGVRFAANSSASRGARFAKNGVAVPSSDNLIPTTPGGSCAISAKTIQIDLLVGDYVELQCWQNTGVTPIAVDAASIGCKYLGPV